MTERAYWGLWFFSAAVICSQPALAATQQITPVPATQIATSNQSVSIGALYLSADPCDANLTGLGLRVHWDSSRLSLSSVTNVLPTALVAQGPTKNDLADLDGDPATDKFVHVAWADVDGQWTGTACDQATSLVQLNFTTRPDFAGSTAVNFTASSTAAGWDFSAISAEISDSSAIDSDGDGIPDLVDTDDDNDGMPDVWENAEGFDPLNAGDASGRSRRRRLHHRRGVRRRHRSAR